MPNIFFEFLRASPYGAFCRLIWLNQGTPMNSQYYRWFMTVVFGQMPWLFCPSMINAFNLALSWADMEVNANNRPNSNMTVLEGIGGLWWKYLQRSRSGLRLLQNKKATAWAVPGNADEQKKSHRLPLFDGRSYPQNINGPPTRERKDLASNSSFKKQREERTSGKSFKFPSRSFQKQET